jgi:hypothetical protein
MHFLTSYVAAPKVDKILPSHGPAYSETEVRKLIGNKVKERKKKGRKGRERKGKERRRKGKEREGRKRKERKGTKKKRKERRSWTYRTGCHSWTEVSRPHGGLFWYHAKS